MKIDDNFSLEPDAYQWTLTYESKRTEEGKVITSKNQWYFPNIRLALLHYMDECLKPAPIAVDIIAKIDEAMANINLMK